MYSILRRSFVAALVSAAVPTIFGQSESVDSEVRKAEEAWAAAVKTGNRTALDKLLAPDLVYTHSTGSVDTKAQYLEKMKAGTQKYTDLQYSNTKVRSWGGDAGVVNTQLRMIGATNGTPFDNVVYVVHVWTKQNGAWQLVAHQSTRKGQ